MATCCVCRGDLSSGLVKKKRKKLHGLSCKESRRVLEEEVNETLGVGLDGLVETGLDSFICKSCDAKLPKISELKLQIEHLKSEVQSYVASLHCKPSSETVRGGVKRKAAPLSIPSKHSRLEVAQPECSSTATVKSPDVSVSLVLNSCLLQGC